MDSGGLYGIAANFAEAHSIPTVAAGLDISLLVHLRPQKHVCSNHQEKVLFSISIMKEGQSSLYSQLRPRAMLNLFSPISHKIVSRDLDHLNILQKFQFQ